MKLTKNVNDMVRNRPKLSFLNRRWQKSNYLISHQKVLGGGGGGGGGGLGWSRPVLGLSLGQAEQ